MHQTHHQSPSTSLPGPILIRTSRANDQPALRRLAQLDSRELAAGTFLLAETGDELIAAVPLDAEGESLGDPFRPTAEVRELLELRVRQLRRRYLAESRFGGLARTLPRAA